MERIGLSGFIGTVGFGRRTLGPMVATATSAGSPSKEYVTTLQSEQPVSRQTKPHAITIGKLLGATGCFAILFALVVHVQNFGFWFLWLAVPPLLGGIHGTYKNGIKGFLEGAVCGALLLPLYLLLLIVVLMWIFLVSLVLSSMMSA